MFKTSTKDGLAQRYDRCASSQDTGKRGEQFSGGWAMYWINTLNYLE